MADIVDDQPAIENSAFYGESRVFEPAVIGVGDGGAFMPARGCGDGRKRERGGDERFAEHGWSSLFVDISITRLRGKRLIEVNHEDVRGFIPHVSVSPAPASGAQARAKTGSPCALARRTNPRYVFVKILTPRETDP